MPTLFSKLNNRSAGKAPASRYGPAISSTDLTLFPASSPTSQDARELNDDVLPHHNHHQQQQQYVGGGASTPANIHPISSSQRQDAGVLAERSTNLREGVGHAFHQKHENNTHTLGVGEFGVPQRQSSSRMHKTLPAKPVTASFSTSRTSPTTKLAKLTSPTDPSPASENANDQQPPMYGHSPIAWNMQLDVPKVAELVLMCGEQIRMRGLTMPLIFSSMALDLSQHNVTSLINAYLTTPQTFYGSESKFANPHDLAAVIKWALSRLSRVFPVPIPSTSRKGADASEEHILIHQRGFLELDSYTVWSAYERNASYPVAAFSTFLDGLSSSTAALLVALFSLLSSTTSYSLRNGMTPSRLARLFGILIFGVPEDESFDRTYEAYIKASNATEHLLLAYIRDMSTMEPLPTRLADHVRGYPNMLAADLAKPGRGVRGVPFTMVSRIVRLYSVDLLTQARYLPLADRSVEWEACCDDANGVDGEPQLSDRYRKLINLRSKRPKGANPARATSQHEQDNRGAGMNSDEAYDRSRIFGHHAVKPSEDLIDSYSSLADKAWDEFISDGFAAPDSTKLAFDLRESERKARMQKSNPVPWSQFEQSGFSLRDDGLASVLAFDELLSEDVKRWPEERAELLEKIRKTNKAMPAFNYDTTPYVISSPASCGIAQGQWDDKPYSRMDDVFPEVFADVLLGNGWSNRDELTHRNANFVVVQYKSRPNTSTVGSQGVESTKSTATPTLDETTDDRTDAAWFVIEEVVPAQYRSELEMLGRKKNRSRASLRNLTRFRRRKDASAHTADLSFFDDVFRPGSGGTTKKLTLRNPAMAASLENTALAVDNDDRNSFLRASPILSSDDRSVPPANASSSVRLLSSLKSRASKRLRSKGVNNASSSQRGEEDEHQTKPPAPPPKEKSIAQSGSWDSVDFETRSLHDPEMDAFATSDKRKGGGVLLKSAMSKTAERRQSKDDTWLDIMVRANGMRMAGQEVPTQDRLLQGHVEHPTAGNNSPKRNGIAEPTEGKGRPAPPGRNGSLSAAETNGKEHGRARDATTIDALGWSREDYVTSSNDKRKNAAADKEEPMSGSTISSSTKGEQSDEASVAAPGNHTAPPTTAASPRGPKDSTAAVNDAHSPNKSDERETDEDASSSTLRHLRSLPPRHSSSESERERARDERIEAAKRRARELRANLTPVTMNELERKREERSRSSRTDAAETSISAPPAEQLRGQLTPVRSSSIANASEQSSPPSPSPRTPSSKPRDDPFAKDRFSGRVASLTSKFGGTTGKGSPAAAASPGPNDDQVDLQASSAGEAAGKAHSTELPKSDVFTASLFSNLDQSPATAGAAAAAAIQGSPPVLASSPAPTPPPLVPSPTSDKVATVSILTPQQLRAEEEDRATAMPPGFSLRYQPGMPLSNVEEERESVMSGSNA